MLISYSNGQTSVVLRVKIRNSSVSTGAGLTGLAYNSSGLIISTIADNEASATTYTVAGSTIETITTLGTFAAPTATKCRFKEVDSTNHKGVYEIQIADARFAVSGAKSLLISILGATNAAECDVVIPLTTVNPYVTAGKLPVTLASTDVTGNVAADLQTIKTQAVTCSGGVTVPAATLASTTNITAGTITTTTNLTNAATAGDFTSTMKTSIGTAVAASAVASVTAGVTVSTNNDKTGYSLSVTPPTAAAIATAVWSDTTAGDFTTASSPGKILVTQLGGTFTTTSSSVFSTASLANAPTGGSAPSAATIAAAVWDELKSSHTTSGTFGYNLDATVSSVYSRLGAPAGASIAADIAAVKVDTAAVLDDTGTSGVVVASGSKTGYSLASSGLDAIVIESGMNARQAMSINTAALAGVLAGGGTTTVTIKGAGVATTRITSTVDGDGNRSAVTLVLPS